MTKWKMLVCVLAMLPAVPFAKAEGYASPGAGFGIGGQYWNLHEMADIWDNKGMWGGGLTIRIRPMKYIGIDLHAAYMMTQCDDLWIGDREARDATLWSVPLEAGLVVTYPVGDVLMLYGGGGPGYYCYGGNAKMPELRGRRTEYAKKDIELENDLGWYAVAGINIRLGEGVSLFAEGRYTDSQIKLEHPEKYADSGNSYDENDTSGFGAQIGFMFGY